MFKGKLNYKFIEKMNNLGIINIYEWSLIDINIRN